MPKTPVIVSREDLEEVRAYLFSIYAHFQDYKDGKAIIAQVHHTSQLGRWRDGLAKLDAVLKEAQGLPALEPFTRNDVAGFSAEQKESFEREPCDLCHKAVPPEEHTEMNVRGGIFSACTQCAKDYAKPNEE